MTGPKIARRSLLASAAATAAAPATSLFAPLAHAADNDAWTGYTICDSCNHMPMCGIQFEAVSVEPPRHTLDTTSTELARKRCQSTGSEVL